MKINDVEKLLGISKANIRFYEKEGLLTPTRLTNGYRDYTDEHIEQLQNIIILRKLGIPVQEIKQILDGTLPLQTAIQNNLTQLEAQIEALTGAINLCKQIQQEQLSKLDTQRYWDMIHQREKEGMKFAEYMTDLYYWFTKDDPKIRLLSRKYGYLLFLIDSVIGALLFYAILRIIFPGNIQRSIRLATVWGIVYSVRPLLLHSPMAKKRPAAVGTILLVLLIPSVIFTLLGLLVLLLRLT